MSEIAVVLPVYNGMKYLEENITSVLNQSFTEFTFYIADDCSADGSWEYLNSLTDERVKLLRNQKNLGLFPTLNLLCKQADSPIIKLWSQDDIMNPHCLRDTVHFHKKYPQIAFSYSNRQHIDESGNLLPSEDWKDQTPEFIPRKLHDRIALYTGSIAGNIANVAINREKLAEVGYFDETMTIAADFDMWVKLTEKYDIGKIGGELIKLRSHGGQLSRAPEFYLLHLTEEKKIFKRLFARSDNSLQKFGKKNMRWVKYPLYFSFMLLTLRRRQWKLAGRFYQELRELDNVFLLALRWSYLKAAKIFPKSKKTDNSFLFNDIHPADKSLLRPE